MTFRDLLANRRAAYRAIFLDERDNPTRQSEIVLADLRRFCRADRSTATVSDGRIDPVAMAIAEGRREVFLRITQYINLDERVIQQLREGDIT